MQPDNFLKSKFSHSHVLAQSRVLLPIPKNQVAGSVENRRRVEEHVMGVCTLPTHCSHAVRARQLAEGEDFFVWQPGLVGCRQMFAIG